MGASTTDVAPAGDAGVANRSLRIAARRPLSRRARAASLVLVAAAYLVAAKLSLLAAIAQPVVSSMWPPAGIALAALMLWGARLWPGVWAGSFLLNATSGVPLGGAALIASGNTLAALVGTRLLRAAGFRGSLERLRDVLALAGLGAVASPAIAATVGTATLRLAGQATAAQHSLLWVVWWSGDAVGVLTVAPLMLAWLGRPVRFALSRGRLVEAALLALTLAAALWVLLLTPLPYVYLVFPIGAWAAMRFGPRGTATATLAVALATIWSTVHGRGPFTATTPLDNLFLLQLFLALLSATSLALAAMLRERQHAQSALRALSRRLLRAQEAERVRVARELHDQVGQSLVAVRLALERLDAAPAARRTPAVLAEGIDLLDGAIEQIRTLSFDLRPAAIDELDLSGAVRSFAERQARRAGLELDLAVNPGPSTVDRDVEVACFRILQEALANVAAHARARHVGVGLEVDRVVRLTVSDDGVGFEQPATSAAERLGLLSMLERAEAVGGVLRVRSVVGTGTTVVAELPAARAPETGL